MVRGNNSVFCSSFAGSGHGYTIKQNITLCPGHQYALTFDLDMLSCAASGGDVAWQAWAAGQELGSSQPGFTVPDGGTGIGPLYLNALPSGPKGSGTPGSADYNSYQYDPTGVQAYTELALVFSCVNYWLIDIVMGQLDNVAMYQTN